MTLLLLLSIVGLSIEYWRLYEKQGLICLACDDKYLGLVGGFAGAAQLRFWLWAHKRSARSCLSYMPSIFLGPIFLSHIIVVK